jgi:hypothetical protein
MQNLASFWHEPTLVTLFKDSPFEQQHRNLGEFICEIIGSLMLKAPPKSWIKFGFKLGVAGAVLELAALGGSYLFWRKLNQNQGMSNTCY